MSGRRGGILIVGLVAIIVVLVIAGLVLVGVPSRLGLVGGCKTLSAKNPTLDLPDGLSVSLDPNAKGTLALKLTSFQAANLPDNSDLKAALKSLPKGYTAKGPVFQIDTCGTRAVPSTLSVSIPDDADQPESLDLLTWNGKAWEWLGGHVDPDSNVITVLVKQVPQNVIVAQSSATPSAIASDMPSSGNADPDGLQLVTMVFEPGLVPADDGGINGDPAALPKPPEGTTAAQYPSIRNYARPGRFNATLVSDMIADAKLRAMHVKVLTDLVAKTRYAGVQVDYRGLTEDDRAAFADLITQLGDSLRKVNKKLVVVVPAPLPRDDGTWDTTGYDWKAIGAAADLVQVDLAVDPAAYGTSSAEALVRWITGEVSRGKLVLGLMSLSVDQVGKDVAYVSFDQALKPLGNVKGPDGPVMAGSAVSVTLAGSAQGITFDNTVKSYRFSYTASDQTRTVVLGSGSALATKLGWAIKHRVRGVTIHGLLDAGNDPAVFAAMQQYASQTPPADNTPPQITWTAQGASFATSPLTMTQVTWTAPSSPGTYTIAASIAGISRGQTTVIVGPALPVLPVPPPVVTDTLGSKTASADCKPTVKYVADVTVPDNTRFEKGAAFTKTWRVRNSGTCDWPADTVLAFVSGHKLGATQLSVPVGTVKLGDTKDISVDMQAPNEDAKLTGMWRLQSGGKALTGDPLTVVIISGNPPTPTPVPQQPSTGPVAPPSSGPTMYGIHAHWAAVFNDEAGLAKTASSIADLGLGWTKLQVRWGEEDYYDDCTGDFDFDWNHTNEVINEAGAQGQRVLFSIVTSPPCTHSWTADVHAPPDDPNVFAAFVGELASRYAGRGIAIEIWNEQNISREWVSDPQTLDAKRYTAMLAASYNKIKSIDPNIIVISGALAPTGWNDGVNAIDDFTYVDQMKAAGADKFMDCIGTHVNALRVPPDASQGGQYDSLFNPPHHSWFFKDTVQGYQTRMGRQACITEFGVASQQNVGTIKGFEWAKDNTEQNQADWVTQGMSLAKQWGARMVILWNLDYGWLSGVNDNALYSFFTPQGFKRPVYGAVKNWCAANGCK
jgi:spore germination protein YaaH